MFRGLWLWVPNNNYGVKTNDAWHTSRYWFSAFIQFTKKTSTFISIFPCLTLRKLSMKREPKVWNYHRYINLQCSKLIDYWISFATLEENNVSSLKCTEGMRARDCSSTLSLFLYGWTKTHKAGRLAPYLQQEKKTKNFS